MLRPRVIPCVLTDGESLIKTTQFNDPDYIGDPVNTLRVFNELEVDELMLLDITATTNETSPNVDLIETVVDECFMPVSYGGGVNDINMVRELFAIGVEKVVINSAAHDNLDIFREVAETFGNQSLIGAIDVRSTGDCRYEVCSNSGERRHEVELVTWAQELEAAGAGELLVTSINREGTWNGFDKSLIQTVTDAVSVPVIAHGGASDVDDVRTVIQDDGASAAAVGSMVLYQDEGQGVLVNFPELGDLRFPQDL